VTVTRDAKALKLCSPRASTNNSFGVAETPRKEPTRGQYIEHIR
jgi:hypothetical protein